VYSKESIKKYLAFVLSGFLLTAFPILGYPESQSDRILRYWSAERQKKNVVPENYVLFMGSSSIAFWNLKNYFSDLPVVNRGIPGADISLIVPQVADIPSRPSCIVFYCGDNDISYGKTPERVLTDYQRFVHAVHDKYPGVPVVFISIKPSSDRWHLWSEMKKTNSLIKDYSDQNNLLLYTDIATAMLGTDGKPMENLLSLDGLHLSPEGYELWTKIVRPYIDEARRKAGQK
jgi:lysophospholipase L1-like esterase